MTDSRRNDCRYAVYLIPPYPVAKMVADIHCLLNKQFGLVAAGKFQVHATIKGFFKITEEPLERLINELDLVFANQPPFPVYFEGYHIDEVGIGLDVSRIGDMQNGEMQALRKRVVAAVRPFIAPDCDFLESDLGGQFKAHITLAFRDISPKLHDDVLQYLENAPLPTEPISANTYHLLEFFSEDWPGDWEQTLSWRLLKTWLVNDYPQLRI